MTVKNHIKEGAKTLGKATKGAVKLAREHPVAAVSPGGAILHAAKTRAAKASAAKRGSDPVASRSRSAKQRDR